MTSKNLSHRIINSIVWNFFGQGWLIVLSFLTMPYIVHHLNIQLYGIYTLASLIVGYFSFLQLGLVQASIKYIAQYLSAGDRENAGKAFWSCVIFYLIVGIIGTLLLLFLTPFFVVRFFKIEPVYRETAFFALRLGALGFLISMLTSVTIGAIRAVGRFDVLNRIALVTGTVQLSAAVALLYFGYSLKAIIAFNFALQFITVAVYWHYARQLLPFIARPSGDWAMLKHLLKYGGFVTVLSITEPVLANTEKLFLSSLRSVASLTYYTIPFTIVSRLSVIPTAVLTVLFPIFSRLQSSQNERINRELHFRSTLYMLFIYTFIMFFFAFYGGQFLGLWIGGDFAHASTRVLTLLSFAGLFSIMATPSTTLLLGLGKPHLPAITSAIETIIYVPASYVLIHNYGGWGAAFAWSLCTCVNSLLMQYFACRVQNISPVRWFWELGRTMLLPLLLCLSAFLLLVHLRLPLLHPLNLLGIASIFALYAVTVWKFGLDVYARERVVEYTKLLALRITVLNKGGNNE